MKKEVLLNKIEQKKNNLQLKQAIHYTKFDSVIKGQETDLEFLCDVKQISDKKKSMINDISLLSGEFQVISQQQCDQIEEIAILHKQANLFNSTSMLQPSQIQPQYFCQCGCQRGKGEPFPLCMDQQSLAFLGPGVLLIFFYLKQVRWTLLLVFLTYGVFSLSTNYLSADSDYCWSLCQIQAGMDEYFCYLTEVTSFKRKIANQLLVHLQLWIGFFMCIIWIFSVKFIKYMGDSKNEQIDQLLDSASDYTIRLDNLPSSKYNEHDLIEYVHQLWNTRQIVLPENMSQQSPGVLSPVNTNKQLRLRSVQLIYNMENCRKIINDVLNLSYQISKCFQDFQGQEGLNKVERQHIKRASIKVEQPKLLKNNSMGSDDLNFYRSSSILENIRTRKSSQKNLVPSLQNKIKVGMEQHYIQLKQKLITRYNQLNNLRKNFLKDKQSRKELSTACALIQFQSNQQQKQFLSHFSCDVHKNSIQRFFCDDKKLIFRDTEIAINRAAQPSDMIWVNCQKSFSWLRYFIIWICAFLVLAASYSLIHILRTSDLFAGSNTYLTAILVQCFNRIIWISLSNLVVFQYNNTKTQSIISLMKKSITAQVINIIVSPLIFNFIVNDNKIYGYRGLSGVVVIYQFIMFFMMAIFYVLNPFYYFKKLFLSIKKSRNVIIRNLCEVVGEVDTIDQIRPVLSYYQGPQFPIAGGYVYITTAIFHTLFYCHLEPILLLIVIINVSGFLVIMKYILFKRCKIPQLTEIQIFDFAMFGLSCGAAFYGAGSLYFLVISRYALGMQIQVNKFIPSVLCIMIWFASALNPFDIFTKFNQHLLKYLGYYDHNVLQVDPQQQKDSKKRKSLIQANNIIAQIFIQEQLLNKKAKRKQSYYQYSNVKKLLNYEAELKEVIIGQEQKNNIIFFCQSFCNVQKQQQFKKKTINGDRQDNVLANKEVNDKKITIKKRHMARTVPQRPNPNKQQDTLIIDSGIKHKISRKISYDTQNIATVKRNKLVKQAVEQEDEENESSSSNLSCKDSSIIPVIKI